MSSLVVRPFQPTDRVSVRRVCFETGYMGQPIAWQWRDAESFADMFTSWYTDEEPESARVAELDGEVVGYLLGCRDTSRAANPAAIVGRHIVRRGLLMRPGTAGVCWRALGDVAIDGIRRRLPSLAPDPRWPAHFHIDLLPVARDHGVGGRLVRSWLDELRTVGVRGCHLDTWGENTNAIAFFEAMGFRRHGRPAAMPGMRSPEGDRHTTVTMVQALNQ